MPKQITGFNLKDTISNGAAGLIAAGAIVLALTKYQLLPKQWENVGGASGAIGGILVSFATGKNKDLSGGQDL